MRVNKGLSRLLDLLLYRWLGSVQQFTAQIALLFLVSAWSVISQGQMRCNAVHLPEASSTIDIRQNERAYYRLKGGSNRNTSRGLLEVEIDGKKSFVEIPESIRHKFDEKKMLEAAAMGSLGKIYDLVHDRSTGKITYVVNEPHRADVLKETSELLSRSLTKLENEDLKILEQAVHVEMLAQDTVLIKTKTLSSDADANPLREAIKSRFNLIYIQMANWNYRLFGVEKNKTLSNMVMMDEISKYASELKTFEFNMVYDKQVWEKHMSVLKTQIDDYRRADTPKAKQEALDLISQGNLPLLPFAGVATAVSFRNSSEPIELKRYFKNDLEDPLGLVGVNKKNEFILRHRLLYWTIKATKPGSAMEIHAHSEAHVRAYAKLGFRSFGIVSNEKYPGVKIHLLRASREEALLKIAAIIGKTE